ncbi:unnamed protein product [Polarella glacialis]|uniref:Uncharacterized protein n=1 Tax=Polarella glacialis TaxID=89957 RepID=A0A813D9M7_POLGL|nr:unnamed protein product [Polarella glacialis]
MDIDHAMSLLDDEAFSDKPDANTQPPRPPQGDQSDDLTFISAVDRRFRLGRKWARAKPLRSFGCDGCGQDCQSPDPIVPEDCIEWSDYKLTPGMRKVGVTAPQPIGVFDKYCKEAQRRGWKSLTRDQLVDLLESDPNVKKEFMSLRGLVIEDLTEFIDPVSYRRDFGEWKTNGLGHRQVDGINPITRKKGPLIMVPKLQNGYYEGEWEFSEAVEDRKVKDDDQDTLRLAQLEEAGETAMSALPCVGSGKTTTTWADLLAMDSSDLASAMDPKDAAGLAGAKPVALVEDDEAESVDQEELDEYKASIEQQHDQPDSQAGALIMASNPSRNRRISTASSSFRGTHSSSSLGSAAGPSSCNLNWAPIAGQLGQAGEDPLTELAEQRGNAAKGRLADPSTFLTKVFAEMPEGGNQQKFSAFVNGIRKHLTVIQQAAAGNNKIKDQEIKSTVTALRKTGKTLNKADEHEGLGKIVQDVCSYANLLQTLRTMATAKAKSSPATWCSGEINPSQAVKDLLQACDAIKPGMVVAIPVSWMKVLVKLDFTIGLEATEEITATKIYEFAAMAFLDFEAKLNGDYEFGGTTDIMLCCLEGLQNESAISCQNAIVSMALARLFNERGNALSPQEMVTLFLQPVFDNPSVVLDTELRKFLRNLFTLGCQESTDAEGLAGALTEARSQADLAASRSSTEIKAPLQELQLAQPSDLASITPIIVLHQRVIETIAKLPIEKASTHYGMRRDATTQVEASRQVLVERVKSLAQDVLATAVDGSNESAAAECVQSFTLGLKDALAAMSLQGRDELYALVQFLHQWFTVKQCFLAVDGKTFTTDDINLPKISELRAAANVFLQLIDDLRSKVATDQRTFTFGGVGANDENYISPMLQAASTMKESLLQLHHGIIDATTNEKDKMEAIEHAMPDMRMIDNSSKVTKGYETMLTQLKDQAAEVALATNDAVVQASLVLVQNKMPSSPLSALHDMSHDMIDESMVVCEELPTTFAGFLKGTPRSLVSACSSSVQEQYATMISDVKIVLAIMSAKRILALDTLEGGKAAAAFETDKLKPKGLTVQHLPLIFQETLQTLALQGGN